MQVEPSLLEPDDEQAPAATLQSLQERAKAGDAVAHHKLGFMYLKGRDGCPHDDAKAFEYFSRSSELGCLSSTYMVGWCLFQGRGVAKNLSRAAHLFMQAAEAGHRTSIRSLAFCYEGGHGLPKHPEQAARLYEKAVELGDVKAINDLAWCYSRGVGVPVDEQKAVELFFRAARAGNRLAMFNLGVRYLSGQTQVLGKDEAAAVSFFKRGAALGDASSMCTLAGLYMRGIGVEMDKQAGIELLKQAVALGHPKSHHKLARCYCKGLGVLKDEARAIRLYERAAQLGHTKSVFRLARYYVKGSATIQKNEQKAIQLYQEASSRGHAAATYNLGMRYKEGRGVERNDRLCFALFRQAANMGFPPAQFRLGGCYLRGTGVTPDDGLALKYFLKASESGDERVLGSAVKELVNIRNNIPDGSTVFHEICRLGDVARLDSHLRTCTDIDFPRSLDLKSPLMLALEHRRLDVAHYLFARGASVSSLDVGELCAALAVEDEPPHHDDPREGREIPFACVWDVVMAGVTLQSQCRRIVLLHNLCLDGLPPHLCDFVGAPLPRSLFYPSSSSTPRSSSPSSSSSSSSSSAPAAVAAAPGSPVAARTAAAETPAQASSTKRSNRSFSPQQRSKHGSGFLSRLLRRTGSTSAAKLSASAEQRDQPDSPLTGSEASASGQLSPRLSSSAASSSSTSSPRTRPAFDDDNDDDDDPPVVFGSVPLPLAVSVSSSSLGGIDSPELVSSPERQEIRKLALLGKSSKKKKAKRKAKPSSSIELGNPNSP